DAIHRVRVELRRQLASALREELTGAYERFAVSGPYSPDAASAGRRALRNLCLGYVSELDDDAARALVLQQFERADNMTDSLAAVSAIAQFEWPERARVLTEFYERWKHEALVLDKWLSVQATSRLPNTLAAVRELMRHPAFDLRNPNKVRALVSSF